MTHPVSRTPLLLVLCVAFSGPVIAQEWPPAAVVVAPAEMLELAPSVDVPGTVISRFDARLASELSAKLEWIAEVGTVVSKGDTVARLAALAREHGVDLVHGNSPRGAFFGGHAARRVGVPSVVAPQFLRLGQRKPRGLCELNELQGS